VAEGLKYFPTGPVAAMLKALKWGLGTNHGPTPLDCLLKGSGADQPEAKSKADSTKDVEDEEATEPTWFDLLAKGIKSALDGVAPWEPLSVVTSSRKLRRAMIKDGRMIPDGWAAHHIVPENDCRFPEAIKARQILGKFGVELNSSPNGVALYRFAIQNVIPPMGAPGRIPERSQAVPFAAEETSQEKPLARSRILQVEKRIGITEQTGDQRARVSPRNPYRGIL